MVIVDANVILRAMRSRNGASHLILRSMVTGRLDFAISPAVVLEYEDVVKRPGILGPNPAIGPQQVDIVLDVLCQQGAHACPWFRFRPFLADPKDDLYIECALASGSRTIITDDRHFRHPAVQAFGLNVMKAGDFANNIRLGIPTP